MLTPESINFIRVNNDVNGNPRHVCHFLNLSLDSDRTYLNSVTPGHITDVGSLYSMALKRAKKIGGRKFHNKQYGGGIVFQSYNIQSTAEAICNLVNESK